MARYKRSFENLQEIRDSTRDLISRLDRVESISQEIQSSLDRLEKRLRVSDTKRLAVHEGNLLIEIVKRLSESHGIETEIGGNDPEASKKKLIEGANGHITETDAEIEIRWQAATGLSPKLMKAVRKFEEKVDASNILAYETAGQLAQLLMEEEHFKTHEYYYLGGLIIFLYGRTVEEMAAEEDAKDAQRVEDRKMAELKRFDS